MSNVTHFNSQTERMKFLKGGYEEIILPVVDPKKDKKAEEKPQKAKKSAKKSKKEDENGNNKAE